MSTLPTGPGHTAWNRLGPGGASSRVAPLGQTAAVAMIVLVGFMGAGKTTVGHILAERLGTPFVDSDVYIERQLGRTIVDVFAVEGEAHFRELEHRAINELVRGPDAVVALGGGAVEDLRTRAILRNATVVYLRVGYDEALTRVRQDRFRPMLQRADLDQVYAR